MYSRQTKDNNKWCDLANLTNIRIVRGNTIAQ